MAAASQRELPSLLSPSTHHNNLVLLRTEFQRLAPSEAATFLSIPEEPLINTLRAQLYVWVNQADPTIELQTQTNYIEEEVTMLAYLLAIGHVQMDQHNSIAELLSEAAIAAERLHIRTNYALYACYLEKATALALPAIVTAGSSKKKTHR